MSQPIKKPTYQTSQSSSHNQWWARPAQWSRPTQWWFSGQQNRPFVNRNDGGSSRPAGNNQQRWWQKNEQKMVYINEMIRAPKVLLIDDSGEKAWIVSRDEALRRAASQWLDLVQLAYNPIDMVCTAKIVDYGKYMYDKQKDEKEKKKVQKAKWNKEIKVSYTIWDNDLALKVKKAEEFLNDWYSVRVSVRLKWREKIFADKMIEKLQEIEKTLEPLGRSQGVKQEANWISLFLLPKSK